MSILMPVYKTASYLQEAVDSMLFQRFSDFELIVLNDCSPDDAEDILDRYDDPRIVRYRGERNQGLANVLNVGMDMARGRYIARMDSDDISLPERFETQVNYLETHPDVDLCSCGMKLFGAKDGNWVRDADPEMVKITALFFSPILHASSVWRKDSFERFNLRFRQEMVPAEDYDLWCRALVKGLRMVNLPDCLYLYRIRPDQATENTERTSNKEVEVRRDFLRSVYPSLTESDIDTFARMTAVTDPEQFKALKGRFSASAMRTSFSILPLGEVRYKTFFPMSRSGLSVSSVPISCLVRRCTGGHPLSSPSIPSTTIRELSSGTIIESSYITISRMSSRLMECVSSSPGNCLSPSGLTTAPSRVSICMTWISACRFKRSGSGFA